MSLTIADALALPPLRRSLPEVVAGTDNLSRALRWVHVLDVDPGGLLRGGELVLSTGAGPGSDAATQRRFVRALAEEGAAGLLIELGLSYRARLPAALIAEAEALGMPLIATHRPMKFVDVTEAIHGALLERRLEGLRRAETTASRLVALVLDGVSLAELLAEGARALGNPVLLENLAGQLLAFAVHQSSEAVLLEARAEHRLGLERGETSGRGAVTAPVRLHGREWGALTVLDLDRPLEDGDPAIAAHAADAVALRLLHEHTDEQVRARARGSFLLDLVHGRLQERDAATRAAALGFPRRSPRLLPVVLAWRSERWAAVAESAEAAWSELVPPLRSAIGADRTALLGLDRDRLLVVCAWPDGADDGARFGALATELRRALDRRGLGEPDVTIAFGAPEPSWSAAGRRLERVIAAAGAARAEPPAAWHDARRSTVSDLLYGIRDAPELAAFVRDQLGHLTDARTAREAELLRTLEALLAAGGSKAEAARHLHLERQSLYLRLERLEQALDVRLDDPDVMLGLHLAVRALRMAEALEPARSKRLTAAS